MNRKEYGRRFPLKPIEVAPLPPITFQGVPILPTITRQPAVWSGDPIYAGPYTVTYIGDPGATYTTTAGTGTASLLGFRTAG